MPRDPKIRRKDLKSPDEFHTATQRAIVYFRSHEREVTIATVALVVLVALVLGVRSYRSWRAGQAETEFRRAFRAYTGEDLKQAREGFQAVSQRSGAGIWSSLALVYLGDAANQSHDAAAARDAFEKVLGSTREPSLRQIAEYNLGVLDRNSGDAARAAEHFERAASIDGPLRAPALVALAGAKGTLSTQSLEDARAEAAELLPPELQEFVAARAPAASATKPE